MRSTSDTPHQFRADVQGLRAVAVGLVLAFHAGLPLVSGGYVGVDVFFVISGFLITTMLVSELDRTGKVSLVGFYARRAKRLLPAVAVVLVATCALVWLFLPRMRWQEIGGDIVSSALYAVNWRLADRSVDYLAEDSQPSPVQHFWSLAVEEQFYLGWPLLIVVVALATKAVPHLRKGLLWMVLVAVAAGSFGWSIVLTARSPEQAFFVTTTRVWELAIGAAVALAAGQWRRLPAGLAAVIGWAGLAAIGASAVMFDPGMPWPGSAAALPTLGAAAVIVAGSSAGSRGAGSLLGIRPFQWVGDLSYSLYLWHWPLLVAATAYWGGLSPERGLLVVAASFLPAWLTYRLVENPIRYARPVARSPSLALSLGANLTAVGVAAGAVLLLVVASSVPTGGSRTAPGAAVLGDDPLGDPAGAAVDEAGYLTPDPLQATSDVPDVYADGCHQDQVGAEPLSCTYGDPDGETVVAVAGDSKVAQWLPALQRLAEQHGWKLITFTKSACSFAAATIWDGDGRPYESCTEWGQRLLRRLTEVERPDFVITSQGASEALGPDGTPSEEALAGGLREVWSALARAGAQVVVIADNPHPGSNVYECVDEHRDRLTACTYSRDRRLTRGGYAVQLAATQGQPEVSMVDLFDAICPVDPCAPVIGDVLIYRQGSHITATYVETMTPRLDEALREVGLPGQPDGQRR